MPKNIISKKLWMETPADYRTGNPDDGTAKRMRLDPEHGTVLEPVEVRDGALFPLGEIVVTPGVLEATKGQRGTLHGLVWRHQNGDWGVISADDAVTNSWSIDNGERILSAYRLADGFDKVWIITERDRSVTTILLPDEY